MAKKRLICNTDLHVLVNIMYRKLIINNSKGLIKYRNGQSQSFLVACININIFPESL